MNTVSMLQGSADIGTICHSEVASNGIICLGSGAMGTKPSNQSDSVLQLLCDLNGRQIGREDATNSL
jgi:hypothetical protein